jgi:hypothetical protein
MALGTVNNRCKVVSLKGRELLPVKTIDLSDFPWEEHGGSYDEDDRLHTHLGPAEVTINFPAKRIGLKVWKDGNEQS